MKFTKNLRYFAASFLMLLSTITPLGGALPKAYAEDDLEKPVTSKTIVENGDGTYKITLSVTGRSDTNQDNKKANVVVIMDTSGSMDEEHDSYSYTAATYGRYGLVDGIYTQLYYYSSGGFMSPAGYRQVGDNDNHSTVYIRQGNDYTQYNGTRYRRTTTTRTRLQIAQDATNSLAQTLLGYNDLTNDSTDDDDIVEMAYIDFSTNINDNKTYINNPTNSLDTFTSWVNASTVATGNNAGTNWEAALQKVNDIAWGDNDPVYVIFMSDGNPTFRLTSHEDGRYHDDTCDRDLDRDDIASSQSGWGWGSTMVCNQPAGVHGHGDSDSQGWNLGDAQAVATSLIDGGKNLYAVGVFGSVSNMENLESRAIYKSATNQDELEATFSDIAQAITNSLALTNITFTDGITGMTEAAIDGKAGDFTYTKGGVAWTDAPEATYDANTKTVKWDLGNTILSNGETATISFNVYPSQASIDLVADLNNGKVSYDSLTEAQKAQIIQSGSTYTLKTNVDSPSLKYKVMKTTTTNGETTTTLSDEKEVVITNPPAVSLPTDKITLRKIWEDSLDPSQREEICEDENGNPLEVCEVVMDFYKDDVKYNSDPIHITEESGWVLNKYISIAPGLMVVEGSDSFDSTNHQVVTFEGKKYAILRAGHEYYFDEHDINSHYQLTNYRYHPMEILHDGDLVLMNVKFIKDDDGNITGIEQMTAMTEVSATNTIKGGINITKKVYDEEGNEITDSKDAFDITAYLKKPDGTTDYGYDYRIYYGENNPEYESHIVYNEDGSVKYSRTGHILGTGAINETLYVGDTIRVVNVETGTLFYVEESNIPKGYSLDGIEYKIRYGTEAEKDDTVAKTVDGKNYYAVAGNSASSVTIKNKYVSGNLLISKTVVVNSGNAASAKTTPFTFKIKLYTDETKEHELTTPYKVEGKDLYIKSGDTFTLKDVEGYNSIKLLKLPEGAYYEVTEEGDYAGYAKSATGDTGVIVKDTTKTAAFTNTYAVSGKVTIKAKKDLRGRNWLSDDEFVFQLKNKTTGELIGTDTIHNSSEMAEFEIPFNDVTVQPAQYIISEDTTNMKGGLTKETGDITVTVIATDNGDGTLAFTTTYAGGAKIGDDDTENAIVNTYSSEGSIQLGATKILTGRDWQTGETYTFTVFNGENTVGSGTVSQDHTTVTFDRITYTTEDVGKTFVYVIRETTELPDYMSNSGDITATVTLVDNYDGTITATVVYTDANGNKTNTIINTYSAKGDLTLKASKKLVGRSWKTGEKYWFVLKGSDGQEIDRVEVKADGEISFETLNFTLADVGAHTYTITEEGLPTNAGMSKSDDITVTVTVSDAGEGKLGFTTEYTPTNEITNTYQSSGSVDLTAIKDLQGRDWQTDDSFEFTLSGEGKSQKKYATKDQKTVTFDTINYTQADVAEKTVYTYTISETAGYQGKSLSKTGDITATVTLTDDGLGHINTSVTYTNNDTITNTYTTAGSVKLEANKQLIGRAWGANETFTFALKQGNTVIEEKEIGQNETLEFSEIEYTQAGTYTYTIEETSQLQNGMTNSGAITVTVEVVDDNLGHLTATPSYSPNNTITNTYKAKGSIQLDITKAIDGRDWLDSDSFTFSLSGGNLEEALTATADKDHRTVKFGTINYTEADIDESYTYTITETSTMPAGMTAGDPITVTVKITDNGDGTLTATPEYSSTDKTITNTYEANGKIKLQATKKIEGRGWLDGESFEFKLSGNGVEDTQTATYNEQTVTFAELEFDESDAGKSYTYTIEETTDLSNLSMTNSGTITATVSIEDKGNGELEVSVVYEGGEGDLKNMLVNTYTATGEAGLDITKVLEGRAWNEGEEFEFGVFDKDGNMIRSGKVTEDSQTIHFDEITYDQDDLLASDKYEYTIREITELGSGFSTPNEVTATVQLSDDGKGKIYTYISYTNNDTITNTYSANGSVELEAEKKLEGRNWLDGECFEFTLKDESKDIETKSVCQDGKIKFTALTYTEEDINKTYNYTIEETGTLPAGIENGEGKITATVKITDNGDGTLKTVVTYSNNDMIINTYSTDPTAASFSVEKTINDLSKSGKEATFTFELVDKTTGEVIQTETIKTTNTGSVDFEEIEYTAAGTYKYIIREVNDGQAGFTYDRTLEHEVVVEVVDDYENARLGRTITVDGQEGNKVSFTNTYKAKETTAKFGVKKTIENLTAESDVEFEFVLSGDASDTVTITGEGSAEFAEITYTEVGTYNYSISETSGNAGGYSYDDSTFDVVVEVKDTDEAKLVATVKYMKDGDEVEVPEFVNTYSASGEVKLQVTKAIDGRNWLNDDSFEFTLSGNGVEDVKTVTSEEKTVSFDALKFTHKDVGQTYTYTIKETSDVDSLSMVSSGVITVKITVSDNGDGTLKFDITYEDEQGNSSNTVTNSYYATGSAELEITKVLDGRKWNSDDSFSFEVVDNQTGNVIAGMTGTATADKKTVKLGEIEYDQDDYVESKTYTYTIRETTNLSGKGFATPNEVTATVQLSDDNKGNITAVVSYTDGGEITNSYFADGSIELEAEKELKGRPWLDGECFEFTLKDESEDIETKSICQDGKIKFGTLEYTEEDIDKTYTYTIEETSTLPAGIENGEGKITVTVKIEDNLDGTLKVTAEYTNDGKITNTYTTKATEAEFKVTKTIDDQSASEIDSTFTFELVDKATGEVLQTKYITTEGLVGSVNFDAISYDKEGTYEYIIREVDDGQAGFTYDETKYEVVVEVTDDYENAQLERVITINGDKGDTAAFENPYKAEETDATISVTKILEGMNAGVDPVTFTFTLTDESGEEMTTTVDGEGDADFKAITFDKVGVYYYTITEVDDDAPGYTYDDSQYTAIVTVDDIDGHLVAVVTYELNDEPVDAAEFTNTYATEDLIYGGISMTKVLEGRDLVEGEFTFEVYLDGELVTTGYNTADGEIIFDDEIVFTMPGTFSFIVKEVKNEDAEFVIFDENEYEFIIDVEDNGEGELVIVEDTSSDVIFINRYEEPGKGENPRTDDNIMSMMMMLIISLMGLIGSVVLGKRTLKAEK